MDFDSSSYLAYKKNKIQKEIETDKKPISRFSFLLQLFVATFIVIFIIIVISIMKYSSKVDIEYSQGELQLADGVTNNIPNYAPIEEEPQRKIDKRLILIQQEENAPSEARIIEKSPMQPEVISQKHIEESKLIEKHQQEVQNTQKNTENNSKISSLIQEVKLQNKIPVEELAQDANVTIMSKVLIGRYMTFEEAQKLQTQIKAKNSSLQPFVRKVGNVFSVQMGSYQDFSIAKKHAQVLRNQGFDVWIYQQ